ncbi:MAG: hypothetical protein WDZ84_14400 [Rhodovibrionaceae bacterium]
MESENKQPVEDRRAFLEKCGKFAVVTPPAVTLMLSATSARAQAVGSGFSPGGPQGNNGFGNGGGDGVPGNSDFSDENR